MVSIQRKIKEGRGQGHFSEYKPWLTVHDVPSTGVVTRILGWKSGRLHHYLSEHFELAHHYQMEWSEQVTAGLKNPLFKKVEEKFEELINR